VQYETLLERYAAVIEYDCDGEQNDHIIIGINAQGCYDRAGLKNLAGVPIYIKVDKKAPLLKEIKPTTDSGEYGINNIITIEAQFDEELYNSAIPDLKISFSNSGDAKGTVNKEIQSDKIIYTYTIVDKDNGELSIDKIEGSVTDLSLNKTVVTKDINTTEFGIISDTTVPVGTISYDKTTLTNGNVTATITFDEEDVTITSEGGATHTFTSNENFKFTFEDAAGNKGEVVATVSWIDKKAPVGTISYDKTTPTNGNVTATITFDEEDVTITSEGGEIHTFTTNGSFKFTFKDAAGNTGEVVATVSWIDTKAPVGTIETKTNADGSVTATIAFDEENVTITSEGGATHTFTTNGSFTFTFKDAAGNTGTATIKVDSIGTTLPQIVFKDLTIKQEDGTNYVKVSPGMTKEEIIAKMDGAALKGETPEFTKLTSDNKLKTGSEIALNGDTKYVVVVNGDVNGDGKINITDIIRANSIRLTSPENILQKEQLIAADINNTNKVEVRDIISINSLRMNTNN